MKKYMVNLILMIVLFIAVSCLSFVTYTYLTQQNSINNDFVVDTVKGTIDVKGSNTTVTSSVENDDLAYIDFKTDFMDIHPAPKPGETVPNRKNYLDIMASEIKITVNSTNTFPTRLLVRIPDLSTQAGLVYVVIPETEATLNLKIKLKVEANVLKYGYLQEGQAEVAADGWKPSVDMTTLNEQTDNATFRTLINTYNTTILKNMYLNENYVPQTGTDGTITGTPIAKHFRILIWGDFYSLPLNEQQSGYLNKQFDNFNITVKVIQDIQYYGGSLSYEND